METTLTAEQLDETFAALANRTRRDILARLAQGAASVSELAEPFDMTLPAISRHIKVLERAGLITQSRDAQYRPCVLNPEALDAVTEWAQTYRDIWDGSIQRMDDYFSKLNEAPSTSSSTKDKPTTRKKPQ